MRTIATSCLALTLTACIGVIGDTDGVTDPNGPEGNDPLEQDLVADAGLKRLTPAEYRRSLHDLLDDYVDPTVIDISADRFGGIDAAHHGGLAAIAAAEVAYSEAELAVTEEIASDLARSLFANTDTRETLVGCAPASIDDACVDAFYARFGRRVFRRPLDADELTELHRLAELASGSIGTWGGIELATSSLLQSPHFLYRVELGAEEPDDTGLRPYTAFEMASRMSFFLTGGPPDDALLDAAEQGRLDDEDGLRNEADRLLAYPEAAGSLRRFFAEWFGLDRLLNAAKNPAQFEAWSPALGRAMRTEAEMLFDHVVINGRADFRSLFTTSAAFVNAELAGVYGMTELYEAAGGTGDPEEFIQLEVPAEWDRGGLLTTGAFLALQARETRTSPTLRGYFIRSMLLCEVIPEPPPEVDATLPPIDPDEPTTLRELQTAKTGGGSCAACHTLMDPLGFAFENFDAIGRHRQLDNGFDVDASGNLDGEAFENAKGLNDMLETEPRVAQCMVRQLYRHATGHIDLASEREALVAVSDAYAASTSLDEVRRDIILSLGFRYAANLH